MALSKKGLLCCNTALLCSLVLAAALAQAQHNPLYSTDPPASSEKLKKSAEKVRPSCLVTPFWMLLPECWSQALHAAGPGLLCVQPLQAWHTRAYMVWSLRCRQGWASLCGQSSMALPFWCVCA